VLRIVSWLAVVLLTLLHTLQSILTRCDALYIHAVNSGIFAKCTISLLVRSLRSALNNIFRFIHTLCMATASKRRMLQNRDKYTCPLSAGLYYVVYITSLRWNVQPSSIICRRYRKVEEEPLIKMVGNNGTVVRKKQGYLYCINYRGCLICCNYYSTLTETLKKWNNLYFYHHLSYNRRVFMEVSLERKNV
jgi:hypothetical protein